MWQLYLLLFMQTMWGVGLLVLLQKMSGMKKQVDEVTKEVKNYISFVIEDEEGKELDNSLVNAYEEDTSSIQSHKMKQKSDEAQSSLIQAVLGEFFP